MYTVSSALVVAVLHLLMLPKFAIGHLIISKLELESLRVYHPRCLQCSNDIYSSHLTSVIIMIHLFSFLQDSNGLWR